VPKLENAHIFTAIRGIQAGREYYVVMCPLRVLPRLLVFDEAPLPAELRAQRTINCARVPEIARYLVENPRSYVLSSVTASVDGKLTFEPCDEDSAGGMGRLHVPMSARLLINDGQHRRAAIEQALRERPELGEETLPVILFADGGLRRSQQMFADLNRHVVRPTTSLNILYDHRDPLAQLACRLVDRVDVFKDTTETEKTTISPRSNKLHTLGNIYQATRALLTHGKKKQVAPEQEERAYEFWQEIGRCLPVWQLAAAKKVRCEELRRGYVHAHGLALLAMGNAGAALLAQEPRRWKEKLKALLRIDWSRTSTLWEGRALVGGRVSKAHLHVLLTTNLVKQKLGIPLGSEEKAAEDQFLRARKVA
jgi:DNA sulfur modification protein DndB